jgi:hypothetical protein
VANCHRMAAPVFEHTGPFPDAVAGVRLRRLGQHACVISVGADLRRIAPGALEEAAATAALRGCEGIVFDLTLLGGWEGGGLRRLADLWRRLAVLDCDVFVAAGALPLTSELRRLPAQDAWTLAPSVSEALRGLLARPVE